MKSIFNLIAGHRKTLIKYLFSGGTAAFVDIFLLYLLVKFAHMQYLIGAVLAFIVAFFVSFTLQKFWTFEDNSKDRIHIQMFSYFTAGLVTLVINTFLVYFFVHFIHLHYIFAQIIASGFIAIINFIIYRFFIFKKKFEMRDPKILKLLLITQKVDINDDVLGFAHDWILEFSKQVQSVTVICLEMGEYHFPENVRVFSLGKEGRKVPGSDALGYSKGSQFSYLFRFWGIICKERKNYDAVWVHMNQIYVIIGWIVWRITHKKIGLWYAHKAVSFSLIIAEKMSDVIFTSTKSGFRLVSKKVHVIGQGIDVMKFKPQSQMAGGVVSSRNKKFTIVSVARISPVKDLETLIDAVDILKKKGIETDCYIVGAVGLKEHQAYLESLRVMVKKSGLEDDVHFIGSVANKDLINKAYFRSADVFINTGHTGSLDKAGLEAMATGLPVLTCNEAYEDVLGNYAETMMFAKKDSARLADEIKIIMDMNDGERKALSTAMRNGIVAHHSLPNLVKQVVSVL